MKQKTEVTNEITPAQFEEAMHRYAAAGLRGLEITKAVEAEVNEVLAKYTQDLACVQQGRERAYDTIKAYCTLHKKKLFGKRRSIGTAYGTVGYRLGTPRLKAREGQNWTTVLGKLKEQLPGYVRTTEEPAKDLLLADRHKAEVAPLLQEIGVQVEQEELFYIDIKTAA
jgi:phage host-nuclease inhibitor protein Gam